MFLPDGWEFFSKFSDILSKQRRSADNKRFFFVAYMILLVAKHLNKVTIDAFKPRDVGISEMTDMLQWEEMVFSYIAFCSILRTILPLIISMEINWTIEKKT